MSTPHKCPVCQGCGTVPAEFYGDQGANASKQTCRTCAGSGVIWDYSAYPPNYSEPPYKIVYGPTWGFVPTQTTGLMFN